MRDPLEQRFVELAQGDEEIPLDEGALLIAGLEYPHIDVGQWLDGLQALAEEAAPNVSQQTSVRDEVKSLCTFLYAVKGFDGNRDDYYDPRNSYLNDVIARRTGIPISLSVLYVEVARRLGIRLVGVGFPSHFIVRHVTEPDLFIDPFESGAIIGRKHLQVKLHSMSAGKVVLADDMLAPSPSRLVLVRMLKNLQAIAHKSGDHMRTIQVSDRILALLPELTDELVIRGNSYEALGADAFAVADYQKYVDDSEPDSAYRDTVSNRIARLNKRSRSAPS